MEKHNIVLSILTPTYNRARYLQNCYNSLLQQSCMNFEWIVIDDGSTDSTDAVIKGFPQKLFPINYLKKKNGGKHTALNYAHPFIRGKYILILDSDDTLTPDAVEQSLDAWSYYDADPTIGIVTLLKGRDREHPNCYAPDEGVPVDIMAYRRICPVSNDACEIIRSELFLQHPFPVFPGETFLSEGALWNRISFTHKCVYVNRVIYLCDYLEGGLTRSGRELRIQNPRGGMFTANMNMDQKNGLLRRLKNGTLFSCYGYFAGMSLRRMKQDSDHRVLVQLCAPFGWTMYQIWKRKYT